MRKLERKVIHITEYYSTKNSRYILNDENISLRTTKQLIVDDPYIDSTVYSRYANKKYKVVEWT